MTGKHHHVWRPGSSFLWILLMFSVYPCQAEFPAWIETQKIRGTYDFHHVDSRAHLAKLAAGGLNTVLLSLGGLELDEPASTGLLVKQFGWCAELGLHVFVSNRLCGGPQELRHLVPGGRCYVNGSGKALTKTPCPIDPVFWDKVVTKRWQTVARQSLEHNVDGTILDSEMYGADSTGFPGYCYCQYCLGEFIAARGLGAQVPAATKRVAWLRQQGLPDVYRAWKAERAEDLSRATRLAVHAINPDLVLGVLMLDSNSWYANAWARGFGAKGMPVIAFSENTYGTGATPYIAQTRLRFEQMGAHAILCPGMWLQRFEVKDMPGHLFHMAQGSAGYWLFTTYGFSLPAEEVATSDYSLKPPHEQYQAAFRLAGAELDRQLREGDRFETKLKAVHRQASPRASLGEKGLLGAAKVALRPLLAAGRLGAVPAKPTLRRYSAVYYMEANAGQQIAGRLHAIKTGHQEKSSVYALIAPGGNILAEGVIPLGAPIAFKVQALETGIYKLAIVAQANLFAVTLDVPHLVLSATEADGISVVQYANRMYFYVPADVEEFRIEVGTPYVAEQAKLVIWDPSGREAATAETFEMVPAVATVRPTVAQRGKVWSFQMLPTYSANLKWDRRLPPYLAEHPDALLVPIDR
jgi:hypothetical protein